MWNYTMTEWLVAALVGFLIGGLWYGPLFGKAWQRESGLSDERIASSNMALIFGTTFLLNLIASALLGHMYSASGHPSVRAHFLIASGIGWGFVGTSIGVNYLFARKSLKLFFIDAGYWTLAYTAMGAVYAFL